MHRDGRSRGGITFAPVAAHEPTRRSTQSVQDLLSRTAAAVSDAVSVFARDPAALRRKGDRAGQYELDLVADEAANGVLSTSGLDVLSEESGHRDGGTGLTVVVDPVDGSTNASRGLPWYATSLCVVDDAGPWVSLIVNLATGRRWEAVRGLGATRDSVPVRSSETTRLDSSIVVLNGFAGTHLGWRQYRALGATALDLCSVGDGAVDATIDFSGQLGVWDYLGAQLIISEAGGVIADSEGRDLMVVDHEARRSPISAGTEALFDQVLAAVAEARGSPAQKDSRQGEKRPEEKDMRR